MKTRENLILGDWGPTMRGIAWALGHAVMVPTAVAIVFVQWLVFTWRRPLAGVLALVPVRRSMTYPELQEELLGRVAQSFGLTADKLMRPITFAASSPNLADDGPSARVVSPALDAALDQAIELKRPARPVGPDGLVLAPAPRRQRRGSKRHQGPA